MHFIKIKYQNFKKSLMLYNLDIGKVTLKCIHTQSMAISLLC